jgi:hypothetical protein
MSWHRGATWNVNCQITFATEEISDRWIDILIPETRKTEAFVQFYGIKSIAIWRLKKYLWLGYI